VNEEGRMRKYCAIDALRDEPYFEGRMQKYYAIEPLWDGPFLKEE
jgi:hypothetical protein